MVSIKVYSKTHPRGFKSPHLTAALANLGKLPLQLAKIGDLITGEIKRNVSGRILKRRSGDLYNSWQWAVEAINRGWRLIIGSDVVYARIHEFGGWTGANYATKIKKTRYVSKAVMKKKTAVRRVLRDFTAQIWWSHGQH